MRSTIFRKAFDRLVAARERQARLYVNAQLLAMDDGTLKSLGRTRRDIRREGAVHASF